MYNINGRIIASNNEANAIKEYKRVSYTDDQTEYKIDILTPAG